MTEKINPVFSHAEAASYLNISPGHLKRLRQQGKGPVVTRYPNEHGRSYARYLRDDLDAWLLAQREEPKGAA